MAFILRSTRLLYNAARLSRCAGGLTGGKKKLDFLDCHKVLNVNDLRARTVVLSAQKTEEEHLNALENYEKEVYQLNLDIRRKRVFKDDVLKLFESLKLNGDMTQSYMMLLLKCCTPISFMCSEEERVRLAKDIWNCAAKSGIKFYDNHYNALLNVYVDNNHQFSIKKFLVDMKEANVAPNVMSYRYLLRAACQQGDIILAKELLTEMKVSNFPINEYDFNSLIIGHSKIGDFEKAKEILNIMKEKGINPTSRSYVYLLCGYIEHGKFEEFEKLFNELYNTMNVHLLDIDLLEIIYTMAVNNQESRINMIISKLRKNFQYDKLVGNVIQRLLHKRLDSVALRLLETVDLTDRTYNFAISVSKFILNHFVQYRNCQEILEMCEELESIGYAKVAVPYCLKIIFFTKDANFALQFINEMKYRGHPIREHYYWPIIIQASKKGNEKLLSVLKKIPQRFIAKTETTIDIILPNYVFNKDWTKDLATLTAAGLVRENILRHLLFTFLEEKKLDTAEEIVAKYALRPTKLRHFFNILFDCLHEMPNEVGKVINILYNLYHDVYLEKNIEKGESEEFEEETSKLVTYFDDAVDSLLVKVTNVETVRSALKSMLEKKMPISSATGSAVVSAFPNQNLEEIVSKLTDPNLKFEFDETLLAEKSKQITRAPNNSLFKSEDQLQDLDAITSTEECVYNMVRLGRMGKFEKAFEICENFLQKNSGIKLSSTMKFKNMFKTFLFEIEKNNKKLAEKALDLGVKLGIFSQNKTQDTTTFVLHYLECDNISKAIEIFKTHLLTTGSIVAAVELLMKCIREEKTEAVQQITELLTEARSKHSALSHLFLALAAIGEIEKAKALLGNTKFTLSKELLVFKLQAWYRYKPSEVFENFIEVLEDVNDFQNGKALLYKILAQRYVRENKMDKFENLLSEINEKGIGDEDFTKVMYEFKKNLNLNLLCDSIETDFATILKKNSVKINFLNRIFGEASIDDKFELAVRDRVPQRTAAVLATKYASIGDVERTITLVKKYFGGQDIRKIASAFLIHNKVNEYFEFLDSFASKGDFTTISDCFKVGGVVHALMRSEEHFQRYKSLSLQCANETHFSVPVISCFVTCVKLPGKLTDAEEVCVKYSNYFKNVPFSQIIDVVEKTELASNFYQNILTSKTLKDHFSDHLHEFYNKAISIKCEENNFDGALKYLNLAEQDNVDKSLDKNLVTLLKEKLEKPKQDFSSLDPNTV